jgi:hypothetical protein
MRRITTAAIAALALGIAGSAYAATPVEVTVGPELAKKTKAYGPREIELIRKWLDQSATRALNRPGATAIARADLVLADAVPNRPTFEQLGRNNQLSFGDSVGIGGAKITGTVTTADGVVRPVSFAFYETNIQNELGATTWRDAERAFDMVSRKLARGDIPQQTRMLAPTGSGNFGGRFNNRFE